MSKATPGPRRPVLPTVVATVIGNTVLIVSTLVLATLSILVGWVPPRGNLVFYIARLWARTLLVGGGMRLDASREVELDPDESFVFMANHESVLDIPVLLVTLPGQTRFLAKASLFRIPIFGWSLHAAGFIPVERTDRKAAQESLQMAGRRLTEGRSILVFPEATRSRGDRLLPFRRGGFLLALRAGRPIVPVGIVGTREARPPGRLINRPSTIRVRYGAPIDPADYGTGRQRELLETVREEIERLRAEEPGSR